MQIAHKPRVLIVPNTAAWILGQMAREIMTHFTDDYEFVMVTDKVMRVRPDLVRPLAQWADFLVPLSQGGFDPIFGATEPHTPPTLFWLHHVTEWTEGLKFATDRSRELIVCTDEWREEAVKLVAPEKPISIVPHGLDLSLFRPVEAQRERFSIPDGHVAIGFVGSRTSDFEMGRKGLDVFRDVLGRTRESVPNLHVCFLGLGWDDEVAALREMGVSANFLGFIDKSLLPTFYSSIDVYAMTSRVEGGPVPVLEAMACGTPVVASRVGLVPEVIDDGVTGFSADVEDAVGLADGLTRLAESADLRKEIGQAGFELVSTTRSWTVAWRSLEEPMARMAQYARENRQGQGDRPRLPLSPEQFTAAVTACDGVLWTGANWARGLMPTRSAPGMLSAALEGCSATDFLRGMGLLSRVCYRMKAVSPTEQP